ncbi:DUF6431 domain-containing protein [Eubacterium sp. F2]|jgi:hypothetical protein|uniref:DUF6431 domain-containing protein n=1 Tax=Eubacterium sp. F2 TaxID=3381348 RepID=UPI0039082439|nr:DUF6431 domain-containing protein [Eubacterium sp.]MCH4005847.1 DUF6431 domain-containing protein [Eubacterium sp.]MCH4046110.1 DUF6431 domain-containing protein [Eubacterium sp.]MCH4079205.1 DUF6431 domain-containing protein [Eubacterium sp.]MCH4110429.1 DUF6431 domain-containing protein [Eubacterium sp.]
MIIVSNYRLRRNQNNSTFTVISLEKSICPFCGGELVYRDRRRRIMRGYSEEVDFLMVRRLKCVSCRHLHVELPDCVTPYKQFKTEIIENVVDGISTINDSTTCAAPCERTMKRWISWIRENHSQINGLLKAAVSSILPHPEQLLYSSVSLFDGLRQEGQQWLAKLNRIMINAAGKMMLQPEGPKCAPDLSGVLSSSAVLLRQEVKNNESKKRSSRLEGRAGTGAPDAHSPSSG